MANGNEQYKIGELVGKVGSLEKRLDTLGTNNKSEHKEIIIQLEGLKMWKIKTVGFVSGAWFILAFIYNLIKDKIL